MRNTADVTGGKPIAVLLQSISGISAINPLVAFYDIRGGNIEVLFFYFVPDTSRYCHFLDFFNSKIVKNIIIKSNVIILSYIFMTLRLL
jgi:hypothetical protein